MLNKELEVALNSAFQMARQKRHEFMTVEHLLLALLDNSSAAKVLQACGRFRTVKTRFVKFFRRNDT
jgi:ATP-dependent Clp protease ATP-binding subunit ClpA